MKIKRTLRHSILVPLVSSLMTAVPMGAAHAGQIGFGAFSGAAITDSFEDVWPENATLNYTIHRNGFNVSDNVASFNYYSGGGYLSPNTPAGIADINFDTPWKKAGLSVYNIGLTQVQFFDGQDNLLGLTTWVSGGWSFLGWDAGAAGVGRIRVVEGDYGHHFGIDNVTREGVITAVPEPETYAMMLAGLGLLAGSGRRRRQMPRA